ncbi:FG-GAP repeat domain-containing protein [Prosthecobacter fluviatilis]|uniref:FG-GAP repeat domain-containing protein n=1 Tax=Prosthecobacter fluviatilis TaxID=445931 RepID=A0ABW0KP09_9BACT
MRSVIILIGLFHAAVLMADDTVVSAPGAPWIRHTIDNTSRGADGVKLGDLNKDGLPDIVTGWEEGGVVRAYLNPGPVRARGLWPHITVGEVKNVEEAIFADLDGDGRLEVISGTEGKTCTLYWHRPAGGSWSTQAFPAARQAQMWMQAAALDLDGRSGPDLLVASKNKEAAISWLQSPEQVTDLAAWSLHKMRDAGWIMSLLPHDMDGDGDADVVFTDRKGDRSGVFWLENPGAMANRAHGAWKEHAIGGLGKQVMFADLGDVNGDGFVDVAVAMKSVEILLCLRFGDGWQERVIKLDDANLGDAKAVKIADVNGDKTPDLLFTCENAKGEREGIVWLEQRLNGPWKQHTLGGPEGLKYDLMQTLDLDGDGDLDVITCEERDQLGVIWYENPHK